MPTRSSKLDLNQLAKAIVDEATGETPKTEQPPVKNEAAVALGRLGGKKGGAARGETLLLHVINDRGGIATLDQVLVSLYRKTGEVMKRTTLTSKLYRMTQKGTVFVVPSKKGVYSTRRLSQEDVAAMFGEDQQDAG